MPPLPSPYVAPPRRTARIVAIITLAVLLAPLTVIWLLALMTQDRR